MKLKTELKKIRWKGTGNGSVRKGKKAFARRYEDSRKAERRRKSNPNWFAKWLKELFG